MSTEDNISIPRSEFNFNLFRYGGYLAVGNRLYPIIIDTYKRLLYIVYDGLKLYLNIID